jgi:hypothetical protein
MAGHGGHHRGSRHRGRLACRVPPSVEKAPKKLLSNISKKSCIILQNIDKKYLMKPT